MRERVVFIALLAMLSIAAPSALAGDATMGGRGPRVTLFGDSIADSLSYVPQARDILGAGIDLRLELMPCRKLVPPGCAYRGTRPSSVLDIVKSSSPSDLGDIVIVDVGYNDPPNNYESDMATVVDALLSHGVGHVIWVTMREETDGYRQINDIIRSAASREPRIVVADWEGASRGKPWFNPDDLHLNADGAVGLATFLRPYVLAACGSNCAPQSAGVPRNVRPPALRGTPVVGNLVHCSPGTWAGTQPIVLSYRWLRNGHVVAGDHSAARLLRPADLGRSVACRVWAANANGSKSATSNVVLVRHATG